MTKDEKSIERIHRMAFGRVYPLYLQKAERKGRSEEEVDEIICWLTGYSKDEMRQQIITGNDFETFFAQAPRINAKASSITGKICGHRVEEITDKVVQRVRYLDKLIDELAKGRPMEKILRR
ncbi:MAG TPA: DUF2200 domain-containing protein [Rectinemataceae bacterium]|nr:DUF2200 domain-containing protein [Rectinemataceae bacterium]